MRIDFDTTRGTEQHQVTEATRVLQRHVQGNPCAKGVAPERHGPIRQNLAYEVGGFVQRCPKRRARTVSWKVQCPQFVRTCQNGLKLVGRVPRLGEAVEPDKGWTGALALDTEE